MASISINTATCIKCNKCVKICPADVFRRDKDEIIVQKAQDCISCSHCVAICPTDSVLHSEFSPERIHTIDKEMLPSPDQLELLIRSRRSNRAFSTKSIPEEYIARILDAARYAPTASNTQNVSCTVISNPDDLRYISDFTINNLSSLINKLRILKPLFKVVAPGLVTLMNKMAARVAKHKSGYDTILRGATAVIFFYTPKNSRFGVHDSNLAYQNASLMAESLNVAHFYTGYVCSVKNKKKLEKKFNIHGNIQAGMALAMPLFTFEKYVRK